MFAENSGRKRTLGGISIQNGLDLKAWFRTSLLMSNNILTSLHVVVLREDLKALYIRQRQLLHCFARTLRFSIYMQRKKIVKIEKGKKNGYAI